MTRFIPLAMLALAAAACADQSTAPSSLLQPTTALHAERGNPPPPPAVSEGFADFSASDGESDFAAAQRAGFASKSTDLAPCAASASFSFKYSYLINPNESNAFLHINPLDESKLVTIHQTTQPEKKIESNGTLVGPGFTFKISDVIEGSIIDVETRMPNTVNLLLTGTLTTETASCTATANLSLALVPSIIL